MVQFEGGGLFRPLRFDTTSGLRFLQQQDQIELDRQRVELARRQQAFNETTTEQSLRLRERAQIESELNSAVNRRLGDVKAKQLESQARALERGSELLGALSSRFGNAASPEDLERNIGAVREVATGSTAFAPVRKIRGGLDAAFGVLQKGFSSSMQRFAAAADPETRLAMADLVTTPGTESNRIASPSDLREARRIPGQILTEITDTISQIPGPRDVIDPAGGVLPTDFARIGQATLDQLDAFELQVNDPRFQTPDSQAELATARATMKRTRDAWESTLAMTRRVDGIREAAISGVPIVPTPQMKQDLNEYYTTFTQPMVKHAPLPQAIGAMNWYVQTGLVPEQLLADLTDPVMFDDARSGYRASAMMDTISRQGSLSSQIALNEALDANPEIAEMASGYNQWRESNRRLEIEAFQSEDPEAVLSLSIAATAEVTQRRQRVAALVAGVSEDLATQEGSDERDVVRVGGENVDFVPATRSPVKSRDIARSVLHSSNVEGQWPFRKTLAEVVNWNGMPPETQGVFMDDWQRIYEDQVAKHGSTRALPKAYAEISKNWGPPWVGPGVLDNQAGYLPFHPKALAREQGVADLSDDLAESIARVQLEAEVLGPWMERNPGKSISLRSVTAEPALMVDSRGVKRHGYRILDLATGEQIHDGVWSPDYSRDNTAPLLNSPDARFIRQHYESEAQTRVEQEERLAESQYNAQLWRLENRWRNAKRDFTNSPSPSTRQEVNRANQMLLDFLRPSLLPESDE